MHQLNRKGQGTTEYVVILAVVVGLAIFFFNSDISKNVKERITALAADIKGSGARP